MNSRGVLALAIVFTLLLGAYYFAVLGDVRRMQQTESDKLIFELTAADIESISITRTGEQTVQGVRTDRGWKIEKPFDLRAADPAWEYVAEEVANVKSQRAIEESPGDLSTYELDTPHVRVDFETAEGESHSIKFGAAEPTQRNRFARVDDGPVILIDVASFQGFNRSLLDLRNRFLVGIGQSPIKSMALTRFKEADEPDDSKPEELRFAIEQQTVAYEQIDDGTWWQREPVDALAHQEKVYDMANAVQFAVGEEHIDRPESLEDYGLDPARARLTVTLEDGSESTLYFGELTGGGDARRLYAKRGDEPTVFVVPPDVAHSFPKTPQEFRDHRILTRGLGGIQKFVLDGPSGHVELSLDSTGTWVISEPVQEPSDQATVSAYLSYLATAEGEAFPGEEVGGSRLADPWLTLSLYYEGEDDPTVISFGEPGFDEETTFTRRDTGEPLIVRNITVNAFDATLFNFRPKRLCPIRKREAERVTIKVDDDSYEFRFFRDRWLVEEPENRVWERQSDMDLLLEAACNAKALESVDISSAAAGTDYPALFVSIEGAGQVSSYSIGHATDESNQSRYARVAGSDEIFLIEQRVVDRIREALRGVVPQQ